MAYDKTNDLFSIQNDVLTTLLTNNTKISKLNGLKTDNKTIVKAINELLGKLTTAIEQVTTATQQANEAKGSITEIKNEVQSMVTETIAQNTAGAVSGSIQNDEFVCEDNQTVFHLAKTPIDKENILFYINGIKYAKADYCYHEEDNTIEWLSVVKNEQHPHAFSIKATDNISAVYVS